MANRRVISRMRNAAMIAVLGGIMCVVGTGQAAAKNFSFSRIQTLELQQLAISRLTVTAGSGSGGHLSITPDSAVDRDVEVNENGGLVTVSGRGGANVSVIGNSTSIAVGSGAHSSVSIGGHSVSSSGGGQKVAVEATVPTGTTLVIDGVVDQGEIGDIGGDVTVNIADGNLRIGSVRTLTLTVTGAGRVTVDSIDGDARVETTGEPTIRINGGAIGRLTVMMTGEGTITSKAIAERAHVEVVGDGRVILAGVRGQLSQSVVGGGSVQVRP